MGFSNDFMKISLCVTCNKQTWSGRSCFTAATEQETGNIYPVQTTGAAERGGRAIIFSFLKLIADIGVTQMSNPGTYTRKIKDIIAPSDKLIDKYILLIKKGGNSVFLFGKMKSWLITCCMHMDEGKSIYLHPLKSNRYLWAFQTASHKGSHMKTKPLWDNTGGLCSSEKSGDIMGTRAFSLPWTQQSSPGNVKWDKEQQQQQSQGRGNVPPGKVRRGSHGEEWKDLSNQNWTLKQEIHFNTGSPQYNKHLKKQTLKLLLKWGVGEWGLSWSLPQRSEADIKHGLTWDNIPPIFTQPHRAKTSQIYHLSYGNRLRKLQGDLTAPSRA